MISTGTKVGLIALLLLVLVCVVVVQAPETHVTTQAKPFIIPKEQVQPTSPQLTTLQFNMSDDELVNYFGWQENQTLHITITDKATGKSFSADMYP